MNSKQAIELLTQKDLLDKLYGFVYSRVNTTADAEDLCQDIILKIICAIHKAEKIDNFNGFVWTVARRTYADFSEKRKQQRDKLTGGDVPNDFATSDFVNEFIENEIEKEQIKIIFREISYLSKLYRDAFVMYYLDEMKISDIALKLNLTENTVKQRLFYARNTLKKEAEKMNERKLTLKPISLTFIGTGNPVGNDPRNKAERILSQNIVYACKDKAKTAKELSEELCVPMPYIEDELNIQLNGENGTYGLLRKDGEKYISNIIIVDNEEFEEAGNIYTKHLDEMCKILKNHLNTKKEAFLNFPYLSKQTDLKFIFWTLVNESVWFVKNRVDKILETEYFKNIKLPERKFTTVAIAVKNGDEYKGRFYGCDGNDIKDFCGYSYVFIRNIYGKRIDKHFYCGQSIANDETLNITLKSIGGLDIKTLDEKQKEIAGKAIECGFLRKSNEILEPRIVTIRQKDFQAFGDLLKKGYYDSIEPICKEIAKDLHKYMMSHIQKHLLNEYQSYNLLVAGINCINDLIEKCIDENILTKPQNRLGPEGVLLIVQK